MSEVRGSGLECQAVTAQEWLRGATPRPRSGEAEERSNPTSKERWLRGRRRAERSYSTFKVRRSSFEEIPLIQGKEAAVLCWSSPEEIPHIQGKRNPSKMVGVARGRADTLTIITEN